MMEMYVELDSKDTVMIKEQPTAYLWSGTHSWGGYRPSHTDRSMGRSTETTSGHISTRFVSPAQYSGVDASVWRAVHRAPNARVAQDAKMLAQTVETLIVSLRQVGTDLSRLPPLRGFNVDDGSILLEWTFEDARIGLTIEPDSQESGWYLVSNESKGEISASGLIGAMPAEKLILWLLLFAILS